MTRGQGETPWEYVRNRGHKLPDWRPACFISPLAGESRDVLPNMLEPRIAPVVLHAVTRTLTEADVGALRAIPVFSCGGHDEPTYRTVPRLDAWLSGRPWVVWRLYPTAGDRQQIGRLVQNLLSLVRRIDVYADDLPDLLVVDSVSGYYGGSTIATAFDRAELEELIGATTITEGILQRFREAYCG